MRLPIEPRFHACVTNQQLNRTMAIAKLIQNEQPQLNWRKDNYRNLVVTDEIDDCPALHLEDFSEIPIIGHTDISHILQQRSRFRTVDGDWVAQSQKIEPGFSDYCEYKLGLGRVNWVYSSIEPSVPRKLAIECWLDRRMRHDLVQAVRRNELRYIHPYVSTMHVWELGAQLSTATRRPIQVIGPTPAMARWANNKIEFTRAASRLLGADSVPHTESAYNFATLSKKVKRLAATHQRLAIKFPYGTGGKGNFLIDGNEIRGRSSKQVREYLKRVLPVNVWPESGRILIDVWETNVINSPSVQTWIPPLGMGRPAIEGVFQQTIIGETGIFVGSVMAHLPAELNQKIVDGSFLLALLFQQLGYIGRCSFDLILVGDDVDDCRVEFIECNARWGGTSIPMTLMNRLAVDPSTGSYAIRRMDVKGLDQIGFPKLLRILDAELYDPQTRRGQYILMNPARIKTESAIGVVSVGTTTTEANQQLDTFSARIEKMIHCSAPNSVTTQNFGKFTIPGLMR